jgi:hypothetical protein
MKNENILLGWARAVAAALVLLAPAAWAALPIQS